MESRKGIEIPAEELSPRALREVIEEFVTRDGTEMSDVETKVREVEELLRQGHVVVWFDEATRTCNILPRA